MKVEATWAWWQQPVTTAAVVLASGLVAWLVARAFLAIGRRHSVEAFVAAHRAGTRPWVATVMAVTLLTRLQGLPDLPVGWIRAAGIVVIGAAVWLVVSGLNVLELVVKARLPMEVEDNRRIRRARTQVTLLRRLASAGVVLLGIAAVLMSFPGLRTFGASLLASAGLAGILAGLAAQSLLGNVFAGLQLAFSDSLRVDDVVVVEEEWGRVEDITLTFVVIKIWDERRLVLPTSYFTTKPFENWTRTQARVLGAVILHLDYRTPLPELREEARRVIEASPLWDRREWALQVTDTTETTMVIRVLASAADGPSAWDLRCDVREALLVWLRDQHPEALPTMREMTAGTLELVEDDDGAVADLRDAGAHARPARTAGSAMFTDPRGFPAPERFAARPPAAE